MDIIFKRSKKRDVFVPLFVETGVLEAKFTLSAIVGTVLSTVLSTV